MIPSQHTCLPPLAEHSSRLTAAATAAATNPRLRMAVNLMADDSESGRGIVDEICCCR